MLYALSVEKERKNNRMDEQTTTDEYGETNVFSEERLKKLKVTANTEFVVLCEIIKKSEMALTGFTEWAKAAEANERRFYASSKVYVETLKKIEEENNKTKF